MARRKSELPLSRHSMNFVDGDFEAMGELYPSIGSAVAIRLIIHSHVKRVRASLAPVDLAVEPSELEGLLDD